MKFRVFLLLCFFGGSVFAASLEQAERYAKAGEYNKAIQEYRALLAADSKNSKAYFGAAEVRFKMKDYPGAVANYQLAYKNNPKLTAAYEGAAKAYEAEGKRDLAAAERAKKPVAPATNGEFTYNGPLFTKGKALFEAKKYTEAAPVWLSVLEQQPGNPGAYYYAGVGRYEMGELDKAEINLKKGIAFSEEAHRYLALVYEKQGKKEAEIRELTEFIRKSPNKNTSAQERLAQLKKSNETPVAEEKPAAKPQTPPAPETPIAAKPSVTEPEAKETPVKEPVPEPAKQQTVQAPQTDAERLAQANRSFLEGDWNAALSAYREFITSADEDAKVFALLQMGNIYRTRRDFRSAVARYREIVENYPNSEWASEAERSWKEVVFQEKNAEQFPR
ncbi:MAG: tetratricopeptide repeat protein [Fibrobacter sp.]|jgi:tetratricopeptide (TPR) repeat protein|nr:tetratricopeptide repeat protein [Fibrobacter sp.]